MRSILYYLLVLLFTLICFVPFVILFLLTVLFDKERVILHYASRFWAVGIYRCCPWWHLRVEGKERIDRKKAYVIVTNHQAMLDIPLMYVLPLCFKWVSKREVLKMPVFGQVLWMHGDITIARGSGSSAKQMMEKGAKRLTNGTSVIVFPEGTRSKDGRIGRFRDGAFRLARLANVDILPVVHDGNGTAVDGWRIRMPHTFTVRILNPIPAETIHDMDPKTLAAEVEAMMVAEYQKIRPELYAVDPTDPKEKENKTK